MDRSPAHRSNAGRPAHASPRGRWTPWLVLTGSLLLTAAATGFVALSGAERDEARLQNAVLNARERIVSRLEAYTTTLRGGAGLVSVSDSITCDGFREYLSRLAVQDRYPGIQGIGWSERVASGEPGPVDERHAIRCLEPLDARNRAALGYDMYSEPTRRLAMARARDSGQPAMSGAVLLVQEIRETAQQPGFLLYVPVYRGDTVPSSVAERRRLLQGFVYAPFRAHDLFRGIFGPGERPRVSIAVYDGDTVAEEALLYASPRPDGHVPAFRTRGRLQVAGHPWTVVYESLPAFEDASTSYLVPAVVGAGLLASLWLFWLARGQAVARVSAERANRAKSDFLARMSHELRTPLNAIAGYAELLQIGVPGPVTETQQEYLTRIQRAQHHLLGLINDVLNFAKLEAGRVVFRVTEVDVARALGDAETLVAPQAESRRLRLEREPSPVGTRAYADAEKLRQILLNLLSNAVKFTDPGGWVRTSWQVREGMVRIEIRDSGIGVPAEKLESVFDPFVQVDAGLSSGRQGTGLGLSIARELARAMGGDIVATSEVGVGSAFEVVLVAAGGEAPASPLPAASADATSSNPST